MGIVTDTGLKGQEYSWLTTIFYLACMINEPLMGWLVQRMPVAKLLAVCITLWWVSFFCTSSPPHEG
jgi:ACS family allantoate permease-like MFS transporter